MSANERLCLLSRFRYGSLSLSLSVCVCFRYISVFFSLCVCVCKDAVRLFNRENMQMLYWFFSLFLFRNQIKRRFRLPPPICFFFAPPHHILFMCYQVWIWIVPFFLCFFKKKTKKKKILYRRRRIDLRIVSFVLSGASCFLRLFYQRR